MHLILFVLGLMLSAAGLAVVAYGFREIEFSIGTTLILAGTVAGTGGLLMIGLAATVYQLRRIAGIQLPYPMRADVVAEPELASAPRAVPLPAPAKIPFPPRPQSAEVKPMRAPEPRIPAPRAVEPELEPVPDPIFGDMLGQAVGDFPSEPRVEAPRVEPRVEPPRGEPLTGEAPRIETPAPQAAPAEVPSPRSAEPPMVDEADEVPLSPRPPARVQLRHQPAPPMTRTRAAELRPANNGNTAQAAPPVTATPRPAEEAPVESAAPADGEREQPAINFDSLWPAATDKRPAPRMARDGARAAAAVAPAAPFVERRGEAARREMVRSEPTRRNDDPLPPRGDAAPRAEPARALPSRVEPPVLRTEPAPRIEPAPYRAEPYVPGNEPPALRIESEPAQETPAPAKSAEAPRAVAILKSGVVDGMAYTLYADGSIEAQLPAGTLRFGSIAELREHIEKNS